MKKCYLCGLELIKVNLSNLTKDQEEEKVRSLKEDGKCISHEEHIIQNAIAGYLKSEDVLCISCGSELNDSIDKEFTKQFDFLKKLLDLRIDRSSSSKKRIEKTKAEIYLSKFDKSISVYWSKNGIEPIRPVHFFDRESNILYYFGPIKAYDSYLKKNNIVITDDCGIVKNTNIQFSNSDIIFPDFNLENTNFKQALAKIAAGFATKSGVVRENLSCVLDYDNNGFLKNIEVIPFYPLKEIDRRIEVEKHNFSDYPHHYLSLFTLNDNVNKRLYCYIELFSTFQCYVLLTDNYQGEAIFKNFSQTTLYKDYKTEVLDYKMGKYYLEVLNSNGYKMTMEQFNSLDCADRESKVNKVLESIRFNFDYGYYLNGVLTKITNDIAPICNCDLAEVGLDILFLYYEDGFDNELIDLNKYKIVFRDQGDSRNLKAYVYEIASKFINNYDESFEQLRVYNHQKFYRLLDFVKKSRGLDQLD